MRISVKRLHCSDCKKLVRGIEKKANGNVHIVCSRCGKLLWIWNGISWRAM